MENTQNKQIYYLFKHDFKMILLIFLIWHVHIQSLVNAKIFIINKSCQISNNKIVALMKQPTTVQQYKQFCKALKLKILKQKNTIEQQNKQIEKLNAQVKILKKSGLQPRNENDPNGAFMSSLRLGKTHQNLDNVDLQTLKGKNQVMNKFKNGSCSFGITPQSIFRIADFGYKNQVEADYFRQVLSKIDLGLTPMEISALIYIFDENCTGFIHKYDFNDSLNAYQISLEESYLQYTSLCLQKLAKLFQSDKIEINKFYQQMQGKNANSVDLNRFFQKMRAAFDKRLQTREIMGAFNAIDLQTDGIITKKNFVYSLTSAINKMNSQSSIKKTGSGSFQQANNFQKSSLSNKKSAIQQPSQSASKQFKEIPESEQTQIIQKMINNYKITIHQIYQQICRHPMQKRLTLMQFKKIIQGLRDGNLKLDTDFSSKLFRLMDISHKGSIHYSQLMNFYLKYQNDISIIFHLIGIYFKNSDLNAERFWFMYSVSPDADISKAKFMQIMNKSFGGNAPDVWEKLWNYFDKGKGTVSVASINKQLSKFQQT